MDEQKTTPVKTTPQKKPVAPKKTTTPKKSPIPKKTTPKKPAQHTQRRASEKKHLPPKLKLLFTIVNREKAELYADILQSFDVNMQMYLGAQGTANTEMLDLLGLSKTDKAVIVSVIREDKCKMAMSTLAEKFKTIKNGKGIAYTVPLTSTVGVAIYQFLANIRS